MPRCVDCKFEGKYFKLDVPFPIEMMMGMNLGVPGKVNVTVVGFEQEARTLGFTKKDLSEKGMRCQAPGGGPTQDPLVLVQGIQDQPCGFYSPK